MLIFCALLCVYIYRLPKAVREPLPVLMYHFFYSEADGQSRENVNFVEVE